MTHIDDPFIRIIERLEGLRYLGDRRALGLCAAHKDSSPSFYVDGNTSDGRVLIHCFAGCSTIDICSALGLELKDLFAQNGHPRKTLLSDWKLRKLRGAYAYLKTFTLIYEAEHRAGRPISSEEHEKYTEAVSRLQNLGRLFND